MRGFGFCDVFGLGPYWVQHGVLGGGKFLPSKCRFNNKSEAEVRAGWIDIFDPFGRLRRLYYYGWVWASVELW